MEALRERAAATQREAPSEGPEQRCILSWQNSAFGFLDFGALASRARCGREAAVLPLNEAGAQRDEGLPSPLSHLLRAACWNLSCAHRETAFSLGKGSGAC